MIQLIFNCSVVMCDTMRWLSQIFLSNHITKTDYDNKNYYGTEISWFLIAWRFSVNLWNKWIFDFKINLLTCYFHGILFVCKLNHSTKTGGYLLQIIFSSKFKNYSKFQFFFIALPPSIINHCYVLLKSNLIGDWQFLFNKQQISHARCLFLHAKTKFRADSD